MQNEGGYVALTASCRRMLANISNDEVSLRRKQQDDVRPFHGLFRVTGWGAVGVAIDISLKTPRPLRPLNPAALVESSRGNWA